MNTGTLSNIDLVHSIKARAHVNQMLKTQPDPNDECQFEIPDPAETESKTDKSANEMWTDRSLFNSDYTNELGYTTDESAIAKVRRKLISEGINPDRREPTYSITDEQVEWLSSRYDFEDEDAWGTSRSPGFGNFVLDLVYLNVLSFDDVDILFGVLEFNANHRVTEFFPGKGYVNSDGSYSATYEEFIAKMNVEYFAKHSSELSEDSEYYGKSVEEIEKIITQKVQRHFELVSMLDSFFEQLREYSAGGFDVVKPFISDFSDKLKEEFGKAVD